MPLNVKKKNPGKLSFITQSNALRKNSEEKVEELKLVESELKMICC